MGSGAECQRRHHLDVGHVDSGSNLRNRATGVFANYGRRVYFRESVHVLFLLDRLRIRIVTVRFRIVGLPPVQRQSVSEGITWMLGTLILVVIFAIVPLVCSLTTGAGYIFVSLYMFYFCWTVYEFNRNGPISNR